MVVDYESLFQIRLANYDDIPAIMEMTREAFLKYSEISGVKQLDALNETYADVKHDINTKLVLVALDNGQYVGSVRVEILPDNTAYLTRFGVRISNQNNGIGIARAMPNCLVYNKLSCCRVKNLNSHNHRIVW